MHVFVYTRRVRFAAQSFADFWFGSDCPLSLAQVKSVERVEAPRVESSYGGTLSDPELILSPPRLPSVMLKPAIERMETSSYGEVMSETSKSLSFLAYDSPTLVNAATKPLETPGGHDYCHSTTFFLLFIVLFGFRWRWVLERNSIQGWAIVFSRLYIIGLVKYGHTPSGKFLRWRRRLRGVSQFAAHSGFYV